MAYILTIFITLFLTFFEISFLHYFQLFGATVFVTLSFLVAFSVRSNDNIQILAAFLAGSIFDFASSGHFGEFTIIFMLTIILGRMLFYRKTSYGSINSFITLLMVSTGLIYLWQLPTLINDNFVGWQSFVIMMSTSFILTLVIGVIIYKISEGYFNWFQEKTEKY